LRATSACAAAALSCAAATHFILGGLAGESARGGDGLRLRAHRELQIHGIDAHEHLSAADRLPRVHQSLEHLSGDSKSQIALHACFDGAGE